MLLIMSMAWARDWVDVGTINDGGEHDFAHINLSQDLTISGGSAVTTNSTVDAGNYNILVDAGAVGQSPSAFEFEGVYSSNGSQTITADGKGASILEALERTKSSAVIGLGSGAIDSAISAVRLVNGGILLLNGTYSNGFSLTDANHNGYVFAEGTTVVDGAVNTKSASLALVAHMIDSDRPEYQSVRTTFSDALNTGGILISSATSQGNVEATFAGAVTSTDGIELGSGRFTSGKTTWGDTVSAQYLCVDTMGGVMTNRFEGAVTLTGVENISGHGWGNLTGVAFSAHGAGSTVFDGDVTATAGAANANALIVSIGNWDTDVTFNGTTRFSGVVHVGWDGAPIAGVTSGQSKLTLGSGSSLTASSISINNRGKLELKGDASATGIITFNSGGAVDVGLNTLTINGDATFKSGSTYAATLGANKNSLIDVLGTATVEQGANLILKGVDPSQASGQSIFSSSTAISGVFTNALYDIKLSSDSKSLEIGAIKSADKVVENALGSGSLSGNFINAAGVVNQVMAEGGALATIMGDGLQVAAGMAASNPELAKAAFSQMFGEHGVTGAAASQATAQNFSSSIGTHQTQLRDTSQASAPASSSAAFASLRTIRQGYSSFNPNRIWAGGFGAWTRQDNKNNQFGYKYNSGGFILGYDREVGDFIFGVTAAYSNGEIKNNEGFTKTDVDTFNVGMYASYNHRSGLFVDASMGLGYSWNETKTTDIIGGGYKEGKYRNNSFQTGATIGYAFTLPHEFRIIPSVGLQYTHVHQKGWDEKIQSDSQIANWFGKSNNDYLSVPVAVRMNKTFHLGGEASITPELRGAWIYEAKDPQARVRMGYVGSNASTTLYGIDSGRSRGLIGAGVKAKLSRNLDAFVDYNFEFRSGYKNHNVMAGMGLSF